MHPAVSVIVVAYNAESTLARCLDSIVGQSFSDFELIIVDDGSTDGTKAFADSYSSSDSRIETIHQTNSGVAAARQKGLDSVTGSYSIFIDSDDWIEPDMLSIMYSKAVEESSDLVFCDYIEENGLGTYYRKQEPKSKSSRDVLSQMLVDLHGSLCTKLIRTSLYKNSGVRFVEGLNYCEDDCFVIRLLSLGGRVSYVNQGLYHYDKNSNENSISNRWAYRPVPEYALFIESIAPYLDTPELKKNLNNRIAGIIKKLTYAPKDRYKECRTFYRKHKKALILSDIPLSKKMFCILYFNGLRFVSGLRESYQSNH